MRVDVGIGQQAALTDDEAPTRDEKEDMALLADELEHNLARIVSGRLQGFILRGFKVAFRIRRDDTPPVTATPVPGSQSNRARTGSS